MEEAEVRTVLYAADGRPAVVDHATHEKLAALLCEAFGVIAFGENGPPDQWPRDVVLQTIVKAVGPQALMARWPGLEIK